MEVKARVTTERTGHRKIVLSLQKKFVSSQSGLEIVLEKDEERTLNQLRASVRADRQKNFVNIRTKSDGGKNLFPQFSNKVLQDTRRPFKILQETSRYSRNFKSYEKLKYYRGIIRLIDVVMEELEERSISKQEQTLTGFTVEIPEK